MKDISLQITGHKLPTVFFTSQNLQYIDFGVQFWAPRFKNDSEKLGEVQMENEYDERTGNEFLWRESEGTRNV